MDVSVVVSCRRRMTGQKERRSIGSVFRMPKIAIHRGGMRAARGWLGTQLIGGTVVLIPERPAIGATINMLSLRRLIVACPQAWLTAMMRHMKSNADNASTKLTEPSQTVPMRHLVLKVWAFTIPVWKLPLTRNQMVGTRISGRLHRPATE